MFSSVKMLVATDDPAALKLALEVLFSFDIDPRTTSDPRTAAGWLDAERFDAALVDAGLPATADWHPAVRLRRSDRNRETPLFLVAGAEDFALVASLEHLDGVTLVDKPLRKDRLIAAMRRTPSLRIVERRRFRRVPLGVDVCCREGSRTVFGHSVDVSEYGMLLDCESALEERSGVIVQFTLPGTRVPIEVSGVVVRQIDGHQAGVQFTFLEPDVARAIRGYLSTYLSAV